MPQQTAARYGAEKPGAFTVPEAADFLRLSKSTVDRMLRRGTLTRVKIGGRTVIRRSDVEALLSDLGERQ